MKPGITGRAWITGLRGEAEHISCHVLRIRPVLFSAGQNSLPTIHAIHIGHPADV